jgi:hypothetical protein
LEQIRPVLNLINDDDSTKMAQRRYRLGQSCQASRILKVKVVEGSRVYDLGGECRFSALPGSEKRHNSAAPKRLPDISNCLRSVEQAGIIP